MGQALKALTKTMGTSVERIRVGERESLADELVRQAIIEARHGHHFRSILTFHKAIETAEGAGALESAGAAALTLLEIHGTTRLTASEAVEVYCRADELLRHTRDTELGKRLLAAALHLVRRRAALRPGTNFSLTEAVKDYEEKIILRALADSAGSVSRAAKKLGISYQNLVYLLNTRHRNLLHARTPVKKRQRSIIVKK